MRNSPRVEVGQLVVSLPDGDRFAAGNISTGGVGFTVPGPNRVRVSDPIMVRFIVPETNEPLVMRAVVTRVEPNPASPLGKTYVAAKFIDVDALVENPLFRFVEEAALLSKEP